MFSDGGGHRGQTDIPVGGEGAEEDVARMDDAGVDIRMKSVIARGAAMTWRFE